MSRIIRRTATVVIVDDPAWGEQRPAVVNWADRRGELHGLAITSVEQDWITTGEWWEEGRVTRRRYWRVLLKGGGRADLYQELDHPGQPWVIDRVED